MKDELQPIGKPQKIDMETPRALVGWSHFDMPNGIDLRMECARSRIALDNDLIEQRHVVMTRNQALLLARYLLKVTGQTLPNEAPPTMWSRLKSAVSPVKAPVSGLGKRTPGSLAS